MAVPLLHAALLIYFDGLPHGVASTMADDGASCYATYDAHGRRYRQRP